MTTTSPAVTDEPGVVDPAKVPAAVDSGAVDSEERPGLREFLVQKRAALLASEAEPPPAPLAIRAQATAEGRSGIRRIRIRDHQILSDSPASFAGYDLGPTSPELQLGVLASCLTHVFEIVAARLRLPLDELRVEVEGQLESRRGLPGFEAALREPHNIRYEVFITSPASAEEIAELYRTVEEECPILALLTSPQTISGSVVHTLSS